MNPLPNRPLLNNTSIPLALPNVPPFEQMAYNGRPRKVLPEAGKDFPIHNGTNSMSGPSSTQAATGGQVPPLERSNPLGSNISQQLQQVPPLGQPLPPNLGQSQSSALNPQGDKEKEESEGRQLTAIFRPDEAGEWKEKLRLSHEASEQARLVRESQTGQEGSDGWGRRRDDEEDVKEEEGEVDDDESTVVGEGEGTKVWKAKRTLRKLVA